MSAIIWKPHTTVAAIVEHDGRFLLVEEETDLGRRFNQPAGHLDHGESLLAACVREAREETAYAISPSALVGIYQWSPPGQPDLTYLRFAYAASVTADHLPQLGQTVLNRTFAGEQADGEVLAHLDAGIVRAHWLSYPQIVACQDRHRSPLVLQCIDDYLAGRRFPLDMVRHYD